MIRSLMFFPNVGQSELDLSYTFNISIKKEFENWVLIPADIRNKKKMESAHWCYFPLFTA